MEAQLFTMGVLEEDDEDNEDLNVWDDEEQEGKNIIYDQEKNIKALSLNMIIHKLTEANFKDMNFSKIILMTYNSFSTPKR